MTSLVARTANGLATMFRKAGAAFDSMGKGLEVTKYSEKLVPSTRLVSVDGVAPKLAEECFIAPSASVIGDVTVGKHTSVWYGAVVRGDVNTVKIGEGTSIGDRAVVHVAKIQGDFATTIGNHVAVEAGALIHAASLADGAVVGESAQVLDGAVVNENAMVAPGAIVTPGTNVPAGELWGGSPAKKIRALTEEEITKAKASVLEIVQLASMHDLELAKDYKQVVEEEEDREVIEMQEEDPGLPRKPENDITDVLGQGAPGRIFRSTLTHPHLKKFD